MLPGACSWIEKRKAATLLSECGMIAAFGVGVVSLRMLGEGAGTGCECCSESGERGCVFAVLVDARLARAALFGGLIFVIFGCGVQQPPVAGPSTSLRRGMADCVHGVESGSRERRMWALAEIQERFEVRFAEGGFEATRSLRDEVVDPLVDLYLQRFARRDEENESALVEEERHLLETLWALRDPRALPAAVAAAEAGRTSVFPRRPELAAAIVRSAGVPVAERAGLSRYLFSRALARPNAVPGSTMLLREVPGASARKFLSLLAESSSSYLAASAIWSLGLRAEPEAIPVVLVQMFRSDWRVGCTVGYPQPTVPDVALLSIGLFGSQAFGHVLELATEPDVDLIAGAQGFHNGRRVRPSAEVAVVQGIQALGELGDPRGTGRLMEVLGADSSSWWDAAGSLVMLADPEAVAGPVVDRVRRTQSSAFWFWFPVVVLLTELGTQESVAALLSLLESSTDRAQFGRWGLAESIWFSATSEERVLLARQEWATDAVAQIQESDAGQFLQRCGENLDCYVEPFEQCGNGGSPCEYTLSSFQVTAAGSVLRRIARGNTDVSMRLISRLYQTRNLFLCDELYRTLATIAADDDEVLQELERRAAKGYRDLVSERLRRRFRTRRGLPVAAVGAREEPIDWGVDETVASAGPR